MLRMIVFLSYGFVRDIPQMTCVFSGTRYTTAACAGGCETERYPTRACKPHEKCPQIIAICRVRGKISFIHANPAP